MMIIVLFLLCLRFVYLIIKTNNYNIAKNEIISENFTMYDITKENTYKKLRSGDYEFHMIHHGHERLYLVHVPKVYDTSNSSEFPVMLILHGGGGSAYGSISFFGFTEKSDQEGIILVYPQATGKTRLNQFFGEWAVGRYADKNDDVDETGFFGNVLDNLKKNFRVDSSRVYVVGFSNGAQMAYELACRMSDKITAIGAGGSVGMFDECNLKRPVPVFAFGGTEDHCSSYGGNNSCGGCFETFYDELGLDFVYERYHCDDIATHMKKWQKLDGCSNLSKLFYSDNTTTCNSYYDCKDGSQIVLCLSDGGGHVWPGKDHYSADTCKLEPDGRICIAWKKAVGNLIQNFKVNDLLWDFFKDYTIT